MSCECEHPCEPVTANCHVVIGPWCEDYVPSPRKVVLGMGDEEAGCRVCGDLCHEMWDDLCCDCQRLCEGCGEDRYVGQHGPNQGYGGCV